MSGCEVDSEEGSLRAATIVHISRYPLRWCNPVAADAERQSLSAAGVLKTRVRGHTPVPTREDFEVQLARSLQLVSEQHGNVILTDALSIS